MNDNPEKEEPIYITDQQPNAHVPWFIAQNPDQIALQELPQVPKGQETEPSKVYRNEVVGADRHATVGTVTQAGEPILVQTQKRPDLMTFDNEASDRIGIIPTEEAIQQAVKKGKVLFPSDYPQIPVQKLIETDATDLEQTYDQLRKRRLNRTHLPAKNAKNSARIVKA